MAQTAGRRARATDFFLSPFVYPAARLLKLVRSTGVDLLPRCKATLLDAGVFPILNHYYEPLFDERQIRRPMSEPRHLPGIAWNVEEQLDLLARAGVVDELDELSAQRTGERAFHFNNGFFESGDAEYWYSIVRLKKPRRIVEIGSGFSTLIAHRAIARNAAEVPGYTCHHVCIEPTRCDWLDDLGVTVVRENVETVGAAVFSELGENDVLFIDSSHVIRPQGDVLYEFLELLPSLRPGVIVHVHDIFSPRDYPESWVKHQVRLWNEQYLLEAFLTSNCDWKIIGALNYLKHTHFAALQRVCAYLTPDREPGSFYMQKIR